MACYIVFLGIHYRIHMQIQLWRRRNKENTKHNLYIRYRVNQNRAKVETLKLWEWINPTDNIQTQHNISVKKAYKEILRRTKDDLENNRIKINIEKKIPDINIIHIIQKLNPLIKIEDTRMDVTKKNWLISGCMIKISPINMNTIILIPYLYFFT